VVIFKGVQGEVIGLKLNRVYETSEMNLTDLNPTAQERVKQGIPATSKADAERKLASLREDDVTPICPTPSATPSASSQPTPKPSGSASTHPSPHTSAPHAASPGPSQTPGSAVSATPSAPEVTSPSPIPTNC
jgi:protein phosphatase